MLNVPYDERHPFGRESHIIIIIASQQYRFYYKRPAVRFINIQ